MPASSSNRSRRTMKGKSRATLLCLALALAADAIVCCTGTRTPINILNLDQDTDRWRRVSSELHLRGVPRRRVRRISAVYGKDLTSDKLSACTTRLAQTFCTPGMIGCFLSHRKFWGEVISGRHEQQVVLEDDVVLSDRFCDKLDEIIAALEDCPETSGKWDVLVLGAFGSVHPDGRIGVRDANAIVAGGQRRPRKVVRTPKSGMLIHAPRRPFGTHAYLISKRGADKLLRKARLASGHVDCVIWGIPDLELYAVDPMLAHQNTTAPSTIGATGPWGLERLIPSDWEVDSYSGVTLRWALGEPLVKLPVVNFVLTIGKAIAFTVAGALAGCLPRIPAYFLPMHLSVVAALALLLRIMSLPASSSRRSSGQFERAVDSDSRK